MNFLDKIKSYFLLGVLASATTAFSYQPLRPPPITHNTETQEVLINSCLSLTELLQGYGAIKDIDRIWEYKKIEKTFDGTYGPLDGIEDARFFVFYDESIKNSVFFWYKEREWQVYRENTSLRPWSVVFRSEDDNGFQYVLFGFLPVKNCFMPYLSYSG